MLVKNYEDDYMFKRPHYKFTVRFLNHSLKDKFIDIKISSNKKSGHMHASGSQ